MKNKYWQLFITFFKIGLFTFGGGYAMISLIEEEIVQKKKWLEAEKLKNIIAISESTPGPIAINTSTFVGYNVAKTLGSIVATLAVSLPSLIIIIIISIYLSTFKKIEPIAFALEGARAAVIILIFESIFKLSKGLAKNALFYSFIIVAFVLNFFFSVSSIIIIVSGLLIGIIRELLKTKEVNDNV